MLPIPRGGTSPLQTVAGALAGSASIGLRGRICTCVDPFRRRRPKLLGHAELDLAAGLPPATRRSKHRMIVISPREESGPPARNCTWNSTFARSGGGFFTTGRKWARRRTRTGLLRLTRPARRCLRLVGMVAAPGNAPGPGAHLARLRL